MHVSVPVEGTVEIINSTQISPLVSKCEIKVLYVDHKPNRNGTIITKKVAEKIGSKLPGSPIVGYFNGNAEDFEEHNRELQFDNIEKKFRLVDTTKAYGFVPTDAKVWFQQFQDDDGITRLYLCTEGIIWSEAYPEAKRIISEGNNQSMEFNKKSLSGNWAQELNSDRRFFIINEAIIEKLCVLGENYEPCFEGAQIKSEFSLTNELEELRRSVYNLQAMLKEGGFTSPMENENKAVMTPEESVAAPEATTEIPAIEFKKDEEKKSEENNNSQGKSGEGETPENEDKTEDEKKKKDEYACGGGASGSSDEDKKKKEYSLSEIPEYVDLMSKYNKLQTSYNVLEAEKNALATDIEPLRQFKLEHERADKQQLIAKFYQLSDTDKADVIKNIDTYSLDEIESKLAVLCYRHGLGFEQPAQETPAKESAQLTYNLAAAAEQENANVPAWLQAVRQTEKEMN